MWRCLSNLTSLRDLNLSEYRLPDIPAEVLLLTKLTCLRFFNGLDTMSRDLSPLEKLVELDLSAGHFSRIPEMLPTCRGLKVLLLE